MLRELQWWGKGVACKKSIPFYNKWKIELYGLHICLTKTNMV